MSENNDMQCPWCGGELSGKPGQYVKCRHCGSDIHWGDGKPYKTKLDAAKPVRIETKFSTVPPVPETVPEEDLKRIEEEKKRQDQEELERLVWNALEEEKVAQRRALREEEEAKRRALREEEKAKRQALWEEEEAKRKALWEEEEAKRKARRKEEQAKRRALREEEEAKRQALWEEEQAKRGARLREEKIKQSRKDSADIFSFFVLLLILCFIPAFLCLILGLILTALRQFVESISEFIDYLLLL